MGYRTDDGVEHRARLVAQLASRDLSDVDREGVTAELAAGDAQRREAARRNLPLVASARVASPCLEVWETMVGDGAVRSCVRCDREVFDLGAMTLADADALIRARTEQKICVRLRRRTDGTMMFADCEIGANGVRARRVGLAVASVALAATGFAASLVVREPVCALPPIPSGYGVVHEPTEPNPFSHVMGEMIAWPEVDTTSSAASTPELAPGTPGYVLTTPRRAP